MEGCEIPFASDESWKSPVRSGVARRFILRYARKFSIGKFCDDHLVSPPRSRSSRSKLTMACTTSSMSPAMI